MGRVELYQAGTPSEAYTNAAPIHYSCIYPHGQYAPTKFAMCVMLERQASCCMSPGTREPALGTDALISAQLIRLYNTD